MSDTTPETPKTPLSSDAEGSEPEIHTEQPVSASDHVSLDSTVESHPPELVDPVFADGVERDNAEPVALIVPPEPQHPVVKTAGVESTDVDGTDDEGRITQSAVVEPDTQSAVVEPVVVEPAVVEPVVAPVVAPAESRSVQTVYVREPLEPVKKGNRVVGTLIAIISAVIFAAIYAGVAILVMPLFAPPRATAFEFFRFVNSSAFFIPVLVFVVAFVLLVLIVNRAGWWAHVLGSLFVGILVYVVSIGILLLLNNVIGMTPSAAARALRVAAGSPLIITAGLVAREVSLWMGAAIAARGRRVKAKNAEARASFDSDSARARAEYESAVAANASL
ncbi:MAG: hypothetical protein ABI053_08905 [Lacisediminihabitans sp.]